MGMFVDAVGAENFTPVNATCMEWGLGYTRTWSRCSQRFKFEYRNVSTFDPTEKVVQGDLQSGLLHVPVSFFDAVVCTMVFEHVPRFWAAAASLQRIVAPGGLLVFTVPSVYRYHGKPGDFWRFTFQVST